MEELIDQHEAILSPILALVNAKRERYRSQIAALGELEAQLANQTANASKLATDPALYSLLLIARGQTRSQAIDTTERLDQIELLGRKPYLQHTYIVVGPALMRPILSSPLHTGALGALAGFALGFVFIQMRKMIA